MKHIPPPLEVLKGQGTPVRSVKFAHRQKATVERLAIWITDHVGTMGFFLIILVWTILWLGWNIFAQKPLQFDPYPGFIFWLFISKGDPPPLPDNPHHHPRRRALLPAGGHGLVRGAQR